MQKLMRTRSSESYAAKFPALARRRQGPPAGREHDFGAVMLGHDYQTGLPVFIDETVRLEHALTVGATGGGKTTYEKNIMLQIFRSGRGGIVLDPHGSHPDSLFHELIVELERDGFFDSGRVHIIDPNSRDFTVPINFLAGFEDTDFSVLSDSLLEAVEKVWGGEDTHQKPTLRSILKMTFAALAELGLPLTDAKLLYDPDDRAGIRARALTELRNEYARDELERLHTTSLERNKHDFRAEIVGPLNRLNEFYSSQAIRAMLGVVDEPGMPRRTLDLLEIFNQGDILLINLQHGAAFSKADATLFGALLLRYVFLLASRRTNREPFTLCIDESARFLTGDVPDILAETRKFGIAARFSLQFMAQAGKPDDLIYQALLNSTEIKTVFRLRSPQDAQMFAEYQIELNLERPVAASIRPTVIGHRRVQLSSRGTSTQDSESEGEAESIADTHAVTTTQSRGSATSTTTMDSIGSGEFSGVGDSTGAMMSPQATLFGPNADTATFFPVALSQSAGQIASQGTSQQSSTSSGTTKTSIYTEGEAETRARSRATTASRARTRGHGTTAGVHQAFEPVYADLATSFHSKHNELYKAAELLLNLPVGRAFVSFRGKRFCITVPPPKPKRQP